MVRYMLFMSYIGIRYRGAQSQAKNQSVLDLDSIQGALQSAFLTLWPASTIRPWPVLSSRTDAGVHALCASAHIDLKNKEDTIYDSARTLKVINTFFATCKHEIRLTSFFPVQDTFHARWAATSRTYMYRFAVQKYPDNHRLPIADLWHCWMLPYPDFDVERMRAATRLFMGKKNFQTFTGRILDKSPEKIRYVRRLHEFRVEKSQSFMPTDPNSEAFDYYDIYCSSKGFLYNQVRRMVGAIAAVGMGQLTEKDINIMLHVPSVQSWQSKLMVAPAWGLYLKEVSYDPKELERNRLFTMDLRSQLEARRIKLKPTTTLLTNESGDRYEVVQGVVRKLEDKGCPFVVDLKPDMQVARIAEGLFLSSQDPTASEKLLEEHRVKHVLSLGVEASLKFPGISYNFVEFLDVPEFDISKVLEKCFNVLNNCKGENVLVHCNAGVSRSATVVIAYLMASDNLSYEEALERVRATRSCVRPNEGFSRQLKSLGPTLRAIFESSLTQRASGV